MSSDSGEPRHCRSAENDTAPLDKAGQLVSATVESGARTLPQARAAVTLSRNFEGMNGLVM